MTAETTPETRLETVALPCPTPSKERYATREAAEAAALREQLRMSVVMRPYECLCGWVHLAKRGGQALHEAVTATDRQVAAAVRLPGEAFEELVSRELHGEATAVESAALRHPLVLRRWRAALRDVALDLQAEYVARCAASSREWRERAVGFSAVVTQRRAEAKRLQRRAREERTGGGAAERHLRAEAGHAAVMRLVDAYYDQFAALLAEEYGRVGIEVPPRVASRRGRRRDGEPDPDTPAVTL